MTNPARHTTGVVLDIEGTTTPVAFVYETLFPFARTRLKEFLVANTGDADVRRAVALLRTEYERDVSDGSILAETSPDTALHADALVSYLEWLMDCDRKSPGLKIVQGKIWELGYRDGALRGQVYADVRPALERWRTAGRSIAIYSSGSVLAQRLIFRHSTAGDLSPLIDRYFDTDVGPKRSAQSYRNIAAALEQNARDLVFISDVMQELDAAREAGFQTLLCVRPPAVAHPTDTTRVVQTFDDVESVLSDPGVSRS